MPKKFSFDLQRFGGGKGNDIYVYDGGNGFELESLQFAD